MRQAETLTFDGRAQFHASVLRAIELCRHSIAILDHDLQSWPLESADVEHALRDALARDLRLRVLLAHTEWAERHANRLLRLRRLHSARVELRQLPANLHIAECLLVGDRQHLVRRAHRDTMRGTLVIASPSGAETAADRFEAAWQESSPCLPATTLGLA